MKKIGQLLLAFAITSCALVEHQSDETLYTEYHQYKSLVDSDDNVGASKMLSKVYLKNKTKAEKNIPIELGSTTHFWKHLANEIRTEHSYFEKVKGDSGCLTLNGLDKYDRPSSLSLYYIKENGNWVINGAMVGGHDSIRDYYTKPTCPSRKELLAE